MAPRHQMRFAGTEPDAAIAGCFECGECGRMPLVGERVSLLPAPRSSGARWICETCATGTAASGSVRNERVRSVAGSLTVSRAA